MTLSLLGYLCAQMSHVLAPLPGAELLHQSHVHTMYLSVVASLSSEVLDAQKPVDISRICTRDSEQ